MIIHFYESTSFVQLVFIILLSVFLWKYSIIYLSAMAREQARNEGLINLLAHKTWHIRHASSQLYVWGAWCQKLASHAGINNCIPQYSVRCNYLSMSEIHGSGAKILLCTVYHIKQAQVWFPLLVLFWVGYIMSRCQWDNPEIHDDVMKWKHFPRY